MRNEFVTTGLRRHKQMYLYDFCVIRAVASIRQDEAIAFS